MAIRSTFASALILTLVSTALPALGACPPAGNCSSPGGGSHATDCIGELDGPTLNDPPGNPHRVRCVDGDPTCDMDGLANGACRFRITACLNNPDSRFPSCPLVPSSVVSYVLQNKPVGNPHFDPEIDALNAAVNALLPTGVGVCTGPLTVRVPLRLRRGVFKREHKRIRSTAITASGASDRDILTLLCDPSPTFPTPATTYARATPITQASQLIEGPLARGQLGDFLLQNDKIQVVIQKPGRVMFGIGTYGGNIIDADLNRSDGERDNFEEWAPGLNIENTANYTSVMVLNDGTNGLPAVIRATGPDDLLDFVNGSSVVANFDLIFPATADDTDLPVTVQTDYTLDPGKNYVKVETTVFNTSASPLPIFFGDYLNGSGQVELFQSGYGFGEPLVTEPCSPAGYQACAAGTCDPCNFVGYSGEDNAAGVSYAYIATDNGTTTFTTSGVTVPILGRRAAFVLIGAQGPNFTIPASGSQTFTRYFAIGDGSVASLASTRDQIQGVATTGTLVGTVTSGGQPLALADVTVLRNKTCEGGLGTCASPPRGPDCACTVNADCQSNNCNHRGPGADASGGQQTSLNVVDHFRTAADGTFAGTLAPGSYNIRANKDGRLFGTPDPAPVVVTAGAVTFQDFTLPDAGKLQVTVTDENNNPVPAKVQLVGFDGSPDPLVTQSVFGLISNTTGVFGEQREDGLVYGIALATFADKTGSTGTAEVEAGNYQLVVSHGPRYSAFTQNVTITAGGTTTVAAQVAKVITTPGFIAADFHVHSIDSPDCEVTHEERLATMLADGMDLFTPSDHDFRADYAPAIAAMGVGSLISTAQSAEITTFDYGHFNSWPVTRDASAVNGGGIDWGRAGIAPGMDFPSFGSYNLTPAEIFAAAHADPLANLIQINHVASFFGRDGLDIDTAEAGTGPPTSHATAASRRLDPAVTNYFDSGFDALEVWIGTDGRSGDLNTFVGLNLGDWFNLLNQGILRSGVADSDTHQRRTTQMNARTYVASAVTDPGMLGPEAETLAGNVVAGHSFGTNAPFVTINANATSTGQTAGLALGQPTLIATTDGNVDVTVTVKSPLWAEFDRVEFYVNNAPQAYDHDGKPTTRKRYRVIPNFVNNVTPSMVVDYPLIPGASHWQATTNLNLTGLTGDVWIVALVRGTDGVSHPLFPVLPNSLKQSTNTTLAQLTDGNLGEDGVVTLAFTNPLYVDVDGGSWSAPGVMLTP